MRYRAEVDGLRALAVLPVILFHADFPFASGGFVGVDVFFVISGYLITSILAEKIQSNQFSLIDFYERRARRILPALLFYLTIASVLTVFIYPPHQLKDYGQSLFANSFFASNFFFYLETDYFNDFSETAPLLHTWSLSVEEQYYLFIPVILSLLLRCGAGAAFFLVSGLCLLSLFYAQLSVQQNPAAAFYLLPSRFWELGVGSALALVHLKVRFAPNSIFSAVGCALILIPVFIYDSNTPFPGLAAAIPVAGAALVIAYAYGGNLVARFLSNRLFVGIGLISYSWYLSHHVLFAVARVYGHNFDNSAAKIVLIVASFLTALFSYRYVERPFRSGCLSRFSLFVWCASTLSLFAFLGYFLHKSDGLKVQKLALIDEARKPLVLDFVAELKSRKEVWSSVIDHQVERFDSSGKRRVLILGDSKSEDFFVATTLREFTTVQFRRLRLDDLCMAPHLMVIRTNVCLEEYEAVVSSELIGQAEEVLLTATWQHSTNRFVLDFIKRMLSDGKKVSILSTSNFNDVASLSYVVATREMTAVEEEEFFYSNLREDWRRQYEDLRRLIVQENLDVEFYEKEDAICDMRAQKCSLRDDLGWYIYDSGHLTLRGADFFAGRLKEMGWYE